MIDDDIMTMKPRSYCSIYRGTYKSDLYETENTIIVAGLSSYNAVRKQNTRVQW